MTGVLRGFLAVTVPGLVLMLTLAPTPTADAPVPVAAAETAPVWRSSPGAYADAVFNPSATLDTTQVVAGMRAAAEGSTVCLPLFCDE